VCVPLLCHCKWRSLSIYLYFLLTTALLKWRLGAWDIQELPLLAASSLMKTDPMAGKSWQPSQTVERGRERGGMVTAWAMTCQTTKSHKKNASCTFTRLQSTSTWNSSICAYVSTPLTTRETQVLFVVNSVKLQLTAFKRWMMRRQDLSPCR